jgi:hypothetical protein
MCAHNGGMNANTNAAAEIARPAKGARFLTQWGTEWVVTSVRKNYEGEVRVHATPADAYDKGSRKALDSWDLASWAAEFAAPAQAEAEAILAALTPAEQEVITARAAALDALPTEEEPEVEEILAPQVPASEPHAFSAKGSAKASACMTCGRTWAASAHRKHRAAQAVEPAPVPPTKVEESVAEIVARVEFRRNYRAGYRTAQRVTSLDRADADGRTSRPGWMDGYEDFAAGRPARRFS